MKDIETSICLRDLSIGLSYSNLPFSLATPYLYTLGIKGNFRIVSLLFLHGSFPHFIISRWPMLLHSVVDIDPIMDELSLP